MQGTNPPAAPAPHSRTGRAALRCAAGMNRWQPGRIPSAAKEPALPGGQGKACRGRIALTHAGAAARHWQTRKAPPAAVVTPGAGAAPALAAERAIQVVRTAAARHGACSRSTQMAGLAAVISKGSLPSSPAQSNARLPGGLAVGTCIEQMCRAGKAPARPPSSVSLKR